MIYRFLSKLATQERLEAFPVPVPGIFPPMRWGVGTVYYEEKMKLMHTNPTTLGVSLYQAPRFDSRPTGVCLRFHKGKETEALPDIWGAECRLFISERVKSVIESVDEMEHEYIPIQWIDAQSAPIQTEQNYYWFNQRRFFSIKPSEHIANPEELNFFPLREEEDFIGRVLDTPSLRDQLEQQPIWQHFRAGEEKFNLKPRCILYMNQTLVNALRDSSITGMDLYSAQYGLGEESLCAF
ncbi:hypothetical protein EUZ85_15480 [Hahella sp. KA22]|uniref:imm11 family protein n=1 Tax=Hahella sp. KA22 TaxID=1628392 RepID=UPI000FDDE615|nr:DUF1629 domain-containing protein [Hahella sp. KA22]AZZ92049.1 hypothetical protein ENC22_12915 [Hahella sp. KA22]QAY55420.1 hypothetical protein EUZ85_15480 [Hahella sp. KA22]